MRRQRSSRTNVRSVTSSAQYAALSGSEGHSEAEAHTHQETAVKLIRYKALASVAFFASIATDHAWCADKNWSVYTDSTYQVSIRLPLGWKRSTKSDNKVSVYFDGPDRANIQMGAFSGSFPAGCDASAWAEHPVTPFGPHPHTQSMKIDGQRACVVWPDVALSPHADAMVVVAYPHPIKIVAPVDQPARVKQIEGMYGEFTLVGDREHILPIAKTLRFQVSKK